MSADPARTTRLLLALRDGDLAVSDQLLPLLYDELRSLARRMMGGERRDHTLQPTALIHEAWMRLIDGSAAGAAESRAQFLRLAATAMRRVLVDHARAHRAQKRGGAGVDQARMTLHEDALGGDGPGAADVVAVDDALRALAGVDQQLAQIVELRVFGGLSNPEVAEALGTSLRTVERGWRLARAWLLKEMAGRGGGGEGSA